MIKSVSQGELQISDLFAEEMNFCLDCQACETACPAGVKYGKLVESARVVVDENFKSSSFKIRIKRFLLRKILGDKNNLKFFARLLRFYQRSFLSKLFEKSSLLKIFSNNLPEISKLSPKISDFFSDERLPEISKPESGTKYKTAFHFGCIVNVAFAEINLDTIDVLKEFSCEVFTPSEQVCCGSLHAHNGDIKFARTLAKENIEAYENGDYEYLISNSAGCGAFMKEYGDLLKDDKLYAEKAKVFAAKIKDVSEFLFDKVSQLKNQNGDIHATYHDACHLAHSQKLTREPRELLKSINGLELREMECSDVCCGSAGIYNVIRFDDSLHFLKNKMENINKTGAFIVVTGNPGCISQLKYGSKRFNSNVEVMHPVTLIKNSITNYDSHK